jgi:predicted peptidase
MKKLVTPASLLAVVLALAVLPTAMAAASTARGQLKPTLSADSAIVSVHAIGFVDTDGAKLSAIDVQYNVNMTGADVSLGKYTITDYGISTAPVPEIGKDPGVATRVYVKDKTHVIIEVNTDYQLGGVAASYKWAMMAGVTQTGTIRTCANTITPGTGEVKNYHVVAVTAGPPDHPQVEYRNYADDGTYTIEGTEVFRLHTIGGARGHAAFHATDCWDEATGQTTDVDLPYALYVPKGHGAHKRCDAHKKYALVLHIHDAGFMGTDPMITLTEGQGPVNFASQEVQQIAKRQGLAGIIVVCPQIADSLRSTRDDYSLSAAVPATWQLMDYLTHKYNIDMDHIYGEGQSMGGMQVAAMAAQRDNYFAAWWANGCQWGSNFSLDDPTYNGVPYYQAPADGKLIWTTDSDGKPVNYRNWYYLVSDDNVLINNCKGDGFSTEVWKECKYLYRDLAGAEIPYTSWNPLTTSKKDQNAAAKALFKQPNKLGIYWAAFDGGNHMATWIHSHGVFAHYDWLLSQTRESEMTRDKLDLNKPFEKADVQSTDPDRAIAGGSAYLVTGKYGAGTLYYNSALYGRGPGGPGSAVTQPPGWWPLQAGAGESPMVFPAAMFAPDLPNLEGFNGVTADNPYARVLVLQGPGGAKVAICSLELVNASEVITLCRNIVSAETGVPFSNVWVHATHAITTPHSPTNDEHNANYSPVQLAYYTSAIQTAVTAAAQQAKASFHDALAGWGTGTCDVNMNRDVQFVDGKWYIGLGGTKPSNKTMTVLRVDSTAGQPIGFLMSYGIKPTCIDNTGMSAKIRQISPDVPGKACRLIEQRFGAPALFCMPAAADQVPQKWCYYQVWNPAANSGAGGAVWKEESIADGLTWVNELGTTMANDAIGIADNISCVPKSRKIALQTGFITTRDKADANNVTIDVSALCFGDDAAFVGFKPEMNCVTEQQLQAASPFAHTLMISFMNGDQKYMPDADSYTWAVGGSAEAQKSGFKAGTAEMLRDYALGELESLK